MTRGPRPHRALAEAIPIAKVRGLDQMALDGWEPVLDIAIVLEVPATFTRVKFAPAFLATVHELVDYYRKEIAQLRIIARDAAITAELWHRSKPGTSRFFLIRPSTPVEIDHGGNRLVPEQMVSYTTGTLAEVGGTGLVEKPD